MPRTEEVRGRGLCLERHQLARGAEMAELPVEKVVELVGHLALVLGKLASGCLCRHGVATHQGAVLQGKGPQLRKRA